MFMQPRGGFTIWLTGMQGSGKSALAEAVAERLRRLEKPVELFEGEEWEQFIGKGPGETKEERDAVTRRAGFVARAITRAGGFAIVAQVSPSRELREQLRREVGRFLEVFVDCPFDTLLERDTNNLFKRALKGEITNVIGVTDPYEPPKNPEVVYDSSALTPEEGATLVIERLAYEGAITDGEAKLAPRSSETTKAKPRARKLPATILFTPDMLKLAPDRSRLDTFPVAGPKTAAKSAKARTRVRTPKLGGKAASVAAESAPAQKPAKGKTASSAPPKPAAAKATKSVPSSAKSAPGNAKSAPSSPKSTPGKAEPAPRAAKKVTGASASTPAKPEKTATKSKAAAAETKPVKASAKTSPAKKAKASSTPAAKAGAKVKKKPASEPAEKAPAKAKKGAASAKVAPKASAEAKKSAKAAPEKAAGALKKGSGGVRASAKASAAPAKAERTVRAAKAGKRG